MYYNEKVVPKLEQAGVEQVEKNLKAGLYGAQKIPTVKKWLEDQKAKTKKAAVPKPAVSESKPAESESKPKPVSTSESKPAAKKPAAKTATAGTKKKSRFRSKK